MATRAPVPKPADTGVSPILSLGESIRISAMALPSTAFVLAVASVIAPLSAGSSPGEPPARRLPAPQLAAQGSASAPTPGVFECAQGGVGVEYVVGPGEPYSTIGEVPWATLAAGDTVRIMWRDEPYREKFLLQGRGTADAPIVVCGVPGPAGELPVIDGQDATTAADMGYATVAGQARGVIHVSIGDDDEWGDKPAYIVIQGLHIRNGHHRYGYIGADGIAGPYAENAAGIFVERGEHITISGVELESNGNGLFVASGDSEELRSRAIVLEHSSVHDNGTPDVGVDRRHNIYTEADGMLFQFNEIGPLMPGAMGAALKDRSAGTVVRYNRITGGTRSLDLVDAEDSAPLVRDDPDYRVTLVEGNVFVNDAALHGPILSNMIHYGGDSGLTDNYRKGELRFVDNTVIVRADQDEASGVGRWQTSLFDLDTNDETAVVTGNTFRVESVTPGAAATELAFGRSAGTIRLGVNWVSPGIVEWRYPDDTTGVVEGVDNLLPIAATDAGRNEALSEPPPASVVDASSSAVAAFDAVVLAGAGPAGADNGVAFPCGDGVLCVGGAGAYRSIDDAIAAAEAGDVIQVAGGRYAENVRLGSFDALDPRALTLLGGFSADFTTRDAATNPTVIDGGGNDPAVQLHVVSAGTTVLDGFVLTGGVGLGSEWADGGGRGGGVHAQQQGDGGLVISHNEVFGNRTRTLDDEGRGGGIHAAALDWDGSAPTVRIEHNRVHHNEAGRGAGIEVRGRAAVLVNNLVEYNRAHSDHGGGVYLSALDNTVTNNVVRGNEIGVSVGYGWGGGVLVGGVSATLAGNVVVDNAAPSIGSGVFWDEGATGTMTGDLIIGNRCPNDWRSGAAIYVDGGEPGPSHVVADHVTVAGHHCPELPDGGAIVLEGGSTIAITRSILWDNGVDVLAVDPTDTFTIDDSTTSVDPDPLFADPAAGDYSLQPGSPATGRGAI